MCASPRVLDIFFFLPVPMMMMSWCDESTLFPLSYLLSDVLFLDFFVAFLRALTLMTFTVCRTYLHFEKSKQMVRCCCYAVISREIELSWQEYCGKLLRLEASIRSR